MIVYFNQEKPLPKGRGFSNAVFKNEGIPVGNT
jgi:hypothetical protein